MRPFYFVNGIFVAASASVIMYPGLTSTSLASSLGGLSLAYFIILFIGSLWPRLSFYVPVISRINTEEKVVALTFDDGPDEEVTPLLLDALQKAKVKATFFWVGEAAEKHPQLIQRAVAEGHLLANHTYQHSYTWNFKPLAAMRQEIIRTNRILEKASGRPVHFFRPPAGTTKPALGKILTELDMQIVAWSRKACEGRSKSVQEIVSRLTAGLENGEILLLHEAYYNIRRFPPEQIIEVLNEIVLQLRSQGFRCVRLDTLLGKEIRQVSINDKPLPLVDTTSPVCEKAFTGYPFKNNPCRSKLPSEQPEQQQLQSL